MKNVIFVAPPAAGKGVQSNLLKEKYGYTHISTGDLLRAEVQSGSELGKKLDEIMKSGNLVSDNIIMELLEKCLKELDTNKAYILDGFPRTKEQAIRYEEMLNTLGKDLGVVIFLDIDEELALRRIVGRITCPSCGASYNKYFENMKPVSEDVCDKCASKLTSRSDDNEESFRHRFKTYLQNTEPLLQYFKDKDVLCKVKISEETKPEDVLKEIEQFIK